MTRWRPVDYAVVVLALAIALTVSAAVVHVVTSDVPLDGERAKMLHTIIVAVLTIIGNYVGSTIGRNSNKDE